MSSTCISPFGKTEIMGNSSANEGLWIYILQRTHVATVSGSGFSNDDCIRLGHVASEEMRWVSKALGAFG